MNTEFLAAGIEYSYGNDKYKDGKKSRTFKNVKKDADPVALAAVGHKICDLQGDSLLEATIITKTGIELTD